MTHSDQPGDLPAKNEFSPHTKFAGKSPFAYHWLSPAVRQTLDHASAILSFLRANEWATEKDICIVMLLGTGVVRNTLKCLYEQKLVEYRSGTKVRGVFRSGARQYRVAPPPAANIGPH